MELEERSNVERLPVSSVVDTGCIARRAINVLRSVTITGIFFPQLRYVSSALFAFLTLAGKLQLTCGRLFRTAEWYAVRRVGEVSLTLMIVCGHLRLIRGRSGLCTCKLVFFRWKYEGRPCANDSELPSQRSSSSGLNVKL